MSMSIVYFSASGITRKAAQRLSALSGVPAEEIIPAVSYSRDDLNWMDKSSRSSLEMKDPMDPVEIGSAPALSESSVLLIGFPVWWYQAPSIINTFLKKEARPGMKIAPFVTSGGTGVDQAEAKLRENFPDLDWEKGIRVTPLTSDEELKDWLTSISE